MQFGLLRVPHANSRYFESSKVILEKEVRVVLTALKVPHTVLGYRTIGGVELFCFELENALDDVVKQALYRVSSGYVLFKVETEALVPLNADKATYFKDDLAGILKYSGKTNEDFTQALVNLAVFSSRFAYQFNTPLWVLDPMCGKGTTLYRSLIHGYNAAGIDVDKNAILEMQKFLKRYLKYHMYKHEDAHQTIHTPHMKNGLKYTFKTADTKEHYKAQDIRTLQFAYGDTREVNQFYKKGQFHVFVTDLPYGVQHAGTSDNKVFDMVKLLKSAAREWYKMLKTGGAGAIAYNTYHIERAALADVFEGAGFKVLNAPPYDSFEHWVEQAVNRDVLVVVKTT